MRTRLVYILHALKALALGLRASPLCQFYKRHGWQTSQWQMRATRRIVVQVLIQVKSARWEPCKH